MDEEKASDKSLGGYVTIANCQAEAEKAIQEAAAKGHFLAAVINGGLPAGAARFTFLPRSAFKKGSKNNP
jgi:hypothetical protein